MAVELIVVPVPPVAGRLLPLGRSYRIQRQRVRRFPRLAGRNAEQRVVGLIADEACSGGYEDRRDHAAAIWHGEGVVDAQYPR